MEPLLMELEKKGCDISGSLRRFGNNEKLYLKYLYGFPDENTFEKFMEAFNGEDYECAGREIHTFKGIAGNLGFVQMCDLSQKTMELLRKQDYDQAAILATELRDMHEQLVEIIRGI